MNTRKTIIVVVFVLLILSITSIVSAGQSESNQYEVFPSCTEVITGTPCYTVTPYYTATLTITPTRYYTVTPTNTTTPTIIPTLTNTPLPTATLVCGSFDLGIDCVGKKGYSVCHVVTHRNGKISKRALLNVTEKNFLHHVNDDGSVKDGHENDYVIVILSQLQNCEN